MFFRRDIALISLVVALVAGAAWVLWRRDQPSSIPATALVHEVAGLRVALEVTEAAPGAWRIDVWVRDQAEQAVDLQAVDVQFVMPFICTTQVRATLAPVAQGHFQAQNVSFVMSGTWTGEVTLQPEGQPRLQLAFLVPVTVPETLAGPTPIDNADAVRLSAGQRLYVANCASCHGVSGRGDGSAAVGLSPRPSDFTQHMVFGKHSDPQIFLMIHNGFAGSAMRGYKDRLSADEIWQLVAYLRTFAQPATAPTAGAVPQAQETTSGGAPTVAARPSGPTPIAQAQESLPPIIFARQGNLWRSDGAGAPPRQLTNLAVDQAAEHPAVAPDKKRIAFVATTLPSSTTLEFKPQSALYLMDADGMNLRLLWQPEQSLLATPSWTPDGAALYVGVDDGVDDPNASVSRRLLKIVRVEVATGAHQLVLENAYSPTISPDGSRMAYLQLDFTYNRLALHIAALDGSDDRRLMEPSIFADFYEPRFTPDGSRLVVATVGGPVTDEQGYPIKFSDQSPLQRLLGMLAPATAEAHGPPWELWTVLIDGSDLRRLTWFGEDTPMTAFSPDGRQMVVMGFNGIYLLEPDGRDLRRIDGLGDHGGLAWMQP